jgi:PPOX class probable F420-dependent enzyme
VERPETALEVVIALPDAAPDRERARARPGVTILVDHYEDDWSRLWWIRLRGRARVLDEEEERDRALALLRRKYPQYRSEPPDGPVLAADVTEVRDWTS